MTAAERLIATAEDQVGYMGKRSNAQLDDFKANTPGKYNITSEKQSGNMM